MDGDFVLHEKGPEGPHLFGDELNQVFVGRAGWRRELADVNVSAICQAVGREQLDSATVQGSAAHVFDFEGGCHDVILQRSPGAAGAVHPISSAWLYFNLILRLCKLFVNYFSLPKFTGAVHTTSAARILPS